MRLREKFKLFMSCLEHEHLFVMSVLLAQFLSLLCMHVCSMLQLSFSIERNSGRNAHLGNNQMSGVHRSAANPDKIPIACDPELIFLLLVGNLEINRLLNSSHFRQKSHQHCPALAGGDPLQQGLGSGSNSLNI